LAGFGESLSDTASAATPDLGESGPELQPYLAALRQAPTAVALAHDVGVRGYWLAQHAASAAAADGYWTIAIAGLATVLQDHAYLKAWAGRRAEAFDEPVEDEGLASARQLVAERIQGALEAAEAARGRAAVPRRVAWQLETRSIELIRAAGGIPLDDAATRLACGPLMARWLGLTEKAARFIHELPSDDPSASVKRLRRLLAEARGATPVEDEVDSDRTILMRCFSDLGPALTCLYAGDPGRALELLADLRCAECRARPSDDGRGAEPTDPASPRLCHPSCPTVAARFPVYAFAEDPLAAVRGDALVVTAMAHAALATRRLQAQDSPETVEQVWRTALAVADAAGIRDRIERDIVTATLARSTTLLDEDEPDDAIELLRRVRAASRDPRLDGRLAELLTTRGIRAGNAQNWGPAIEDLREALELNPHVARTRRNLVTALRSAAADVVAADAPSAEVLLRDALDLIETGLAQDGPSDELSGELASTRMQLLMAGLGGGTDAAVELLDRLLGVSDETDADADEAPPPLDEADRHGIRRVQALLEATGLKFGKTDENAWIVPFRTATRGRIEVRVVSIKDGFAFISLPIEHAVDEGQALHTLLRVTFGLDMFKIIHVPGELQLAVEVPLSVLTAGTLKSLIHVGVGLAESPDAVLASESRLLLRAARLQLQYPVEAPELPEPRPGSGFFSFLLRDKRPAPSLASEVQRLARHFNVPCSGSDKDGLVLSVNGLTVLVVTNAPCTSFIVGLPGATVRPEQIRQLQRIAQINFTMNVAKLAVDPNDNVMLMFEVPGLDEPTFERVLRSLPKYVAQYATELGARL